VEEFINDFDSFKRSLRKGLLDYDTRYYYILYKDKNDEKAKLYKTSFKSYQEAFEHAKLISSIANQTNEIYIFETHLANPALTVILGQNRKQMKPFENPSDYLYHTFREDHSHELQNDIIQVSSFVKVNSHNAFDPDDIKYRKNPAITIFKNAIHEISLKEKDLKDSLLYKLFSDDDIINSKLIALESLKQEFQDALNKINNPDTPLENTKAPSVEKIVSTFENKAENKGNLEAINRHRLFSNSKNRKESSTRKLFEHLKTDAKFKTPGGKM
jgi:hypothetical protein